MPQPVHAMAPQEDVQQSPKQIAIVEAATKLFLSNGFGAISVDAIAAQAQVSKRTVYNYFENKEALFAGVMSGVCEKQSGKTACPLANEDLIRYMPMAELLQKTGEHVLGIVTAPEIVEVFRVVIGDSGRFPELGKTFFEFGPASIIEMIARYFDDLNRLGNLRVDDPAKAARLFMAMMVFPIQMQLACGVRKSPSEQEVRDIVADAVAAIIKLYK